MNAANPTEAVASTIDANLNSTQCITSTFHWGETHVHNICRGTNEVIPWGIFDWAGMVFLVLTGIVFVILLMGMARVLWQDR